MALTFPNIDISGDPSEVLCTREEAILWFSSLKREYEESISKLGRCSFNLAFLTKAEIQDMNKRFAGKNKPTNVLSFPSNEDLTEEKFLGDIAICSELIIEEAFNNCVNNNKPIHLNVPMEEPLYDFVSSPSIKINVRKPRSKGYRN